MTLKPLIINTLAKLGYEFKRLKVTPTNYFSPLGLIIEDYKKKHTSITLLQIGANDGVTGDLIYPYIDFTWDCIYVEPNPNILSSLRRNFKGRHNTILPFAITNTNGKLPLWISDNSLVSSIDKNTAIVGNRKEKSYLIPVVVSGITLPSLLSMHKIDKVDIFLCDVEGQDGMVIRQLLDNTILCPDIIIFEHSILDSRLLESIYQRLNIEGYSILPIHNDTLAIKNI